MASSRRVTQRATVRSEALIASRSRGSISGGCITPWLSGAAVASCFMPISTRGRPSFKAPPRSTVTASSPSGRSRDVGSDHGRIAAELDSAA